MMKTFQICKGSTSEGNILGSTQGGWIQSSSADSSLQHWLGAARPSQPRDSKSVNF